MEGCVGTLALQLRQVISGRLGGVDPQALAGAE
jgi:hypothetical protein